MKLFKIKTKIRRMLVSFLKTNRPPSFPFITGDGFRVLAQHILDESSDIKTDLVEQNDIIFVRNDFLEEFFKTKHPQIMNQYILISSNDDSNTELKYEKYINEDKILHWFSKNVVFKHKKITPIPIGLTNYYYNFMGRGKISYILKTIREINISNKKNKISFGFFLYSNKEREKLAIDLQKNELAEVIDEKDQLEYFKKMAKYNFTVSPEGNGIDCHRTWEALYFKTIPIVKRSLVTEYFKNLGLPILIVDTWDELDNFNNDFLNRTYRDLEIGFTRPELYMSFWIDLILSKRTTI
jgi:hypothetical protein